MAEVAPAVLASNGPDLDPFSQYNTTNAYFHDLKVSPSGFCPGSYRARSPRGSDTGDGGDAEASPMISGYRSNHPATYLSTGDSRDVPSAYSPSHPAHNPLLDADRNVHAASLTSASYRPQQSINHVTATTGALISSPTQLKQAFAAKAALEASGRPLRTGHLVNSQPFRPTIACPLLPPLSVSERAALGPSDPVRLECGGRGPALWSTTVRSGYVPHCTRVAPADAAAAFAVAPQRRADDEEALPHGALRNDRPTMIAGGPAGSDEWKSCSRDVYRRYGHDELRMATSGALRAGSDARSRGTELKVDTSGVNALEAKYPSRLSVQDEANLRRADPVEYSVYRSKDPYQTQSSATHGMHNGADERADAIARAVAVASAQGVTADGVTVRNTMRQIFNGQSASGGYLENAATLGQPDWGAELDETEYQGEYVDPRVLPPLVGAARTTLRLSKPGLVVGSGMQQRGTGPPSPVVGRPATYVSEKMMHAGCTVS